jgi:hypothetical protein
MKQGRTLQRTGYQLVRQYICLQTTQCKVPQTRVRQYHFTPLSKDDDISHFKTHLLYTHELLEMAQVHNLDIYI